MLSPAAPCLHDVTAPPLVGAFAQSQGTLALGRTLTSPWRLALGMRVSRAVHATRHALRSACLATCHRTTGAEQCPEARYALGKLDARGLILAALALVALPACSVVEDHREAPAADVYVVEQDVATEPGQHLVTATAACEPGDRVLGGGCSWGEPADPADPALAPVVAAPSVDAAAYVCTGQNRGVGVELKTVRASAVCLGGAS